MSSPTEKQIITTIAEFMGCTVRRLIPFDEKPCIGCCKKGHYKIVHISGLWIRTPYRKTGEPEGFNPYGILEDLNVVKKVVMQIIARIPYGTERLRYKVRDELEATGKRYDDPLTLFLHFDCRKIAELCYLTIEEMKNAKD